MLVQVQANVYVQPHTILFECGSQRAVIHFGQGKQLRIEGAASFRLRLWLQKQAFDATRKFYPEAEKETA